MEIDITDFVRNEDPFDFSASRAERGDNAGPETWANAKAEAARKPLLTTEDQLQELRDHVQSMGFGDEVQGYDAKACNALFIQLISGDMREIGLDECFPDEFDWAAYEADENICHNIFQGHNDQGEDRFFYYLGS